MVTQELANAVIQERVREASEFRRQQEARASRGQVATPRSDLSRPPARRLPLLPFLARVFPTASDS